MKEEFVEINGVSHKCKLQKHRISKNIRLKVDRDLTIKVTLPRYVPYIVAKKFITKNTKWIEKKINLLKLQQNKYYYLGEDIRVIKKSFVDNKNLNYYFKEQSLIFNSDIYKSSSVIELYTNWLGVQAKEYIPRRVKELSYEYNFIYNNIKIKNLKSRWGSCSNKKNLSFNLKLMYFNPEVIDYVIVHELCHLKEMNHSRKYWKLVEEIIPNYKIHRQQLNKIIL